MKLFSNPNPFILLCLVLSLLSGCGSQSKEPVVTHKRAGISVPAELVADVQVNGRVSTLKQVDIVHVCKKFHREILVIWRRFVFLLPIEEKD